MNFSSSTSFQESEAFIRAQLSSQDAPRAILVSIEDDGSFKTQHVGHGESVLNIEADLFDHLNNKPVSTQFLQDLRDYCDGRLAARAEAGRTGGVSMPRAGGWTITHLNAKEVL
jgi:hypothetical protein